MKKKRTGAKKQHARNLLIQDLLAYCDTPDDERALLDSALSVMPMSSLESLIEAFIGDYDPPD